VSLGVGRYQNALAVLRISISVQTALIGNPKHRPQCVMCWLVSAQAVKVDVLKNGQKERFLTPPRIEPGSSKKAKQFGATMKCTPNLLVT